MLLENTLVHKVLGKIIIRTRNHPMTKGVRVETLSLLGREPFVQAGVCRPSID